MNEGDFMIYLAEQDKEYCDRIQVANKSGKDISLLARLGDEYQSFTIKSVQKLLKMARDLDEQAKTRDNPDNAADLRKLATIVREHSSVYANRHALLDRLQKLGKLPSNLPIFDDKIGGEA